MAVKNVTVFFCVEQNGTVYASVSSVMPDKWMKAIQNGACVSQWSVDVPIPSNVPPVVTAVQVSTTELPVVIADPI